MAKKKANKKKAEDKAPKKKKKRTTKKKVVRKKTPKKKKTTKKKAPKKRTRRKKKTLGIVIANKDHAAPLTHQLASIKEQSVKPDEIIIIDDGSEQDNSKQVIQDFYDQSKNDYNIKIELNEKNKGVVATVNRGCDISESDYLYFASADDTLLTDFVKCHKEAIINHQPAITCSDESLPNEGFGQGVEALGGYYIPGHCSCIKKEPLLEFGKFIEEFGFKCDWFLLHAIGLKYGWYSIKQNLSIKKSDSGGYANTTVSEGKLPAIQQAMIDHISSNPLFDDIRDEMLHLINKE